MSNQTVPSKKFVSEFTGIDLSRIAEVEVNGNVLTVNTWEWYEHSDEYLVDFLIDFRYIGEGSAAEFTFEFPAEWSAFNSGKDFYEAFMSHYGAGTPLVA